MASRLLEFSLYRRSSNRSVINHLFCLVVLNLSTLHENIAKTSIFVLSVWLGSRLAWSNCTNANVNIGTKFKASFRPHLLTRTPNIASRVSWLWKRDGNSHKAYHRTHSIIKFDFIPSCSSPAGKPSRI